MGGLRGLDGACGFHGRCLHDHGCRLGRRSAIGLSGESAQGLGQSAKALKKLA